MCTGTRVEVLVVTLAFDGQVDFNDVRVRFEVVSTGVIVAVVLFRITFEMLDDIDMSLWSTLV